MYLISIFPLVLYCTFSLCVVVGVVGGDRVDIAAGVYSSRVLPVLSLLHFVLLLSWVSPPLLDDEPVPSSWCLNIGSGSFPPISVVPLRVAHLFLMSYLVVIGVACLTFDRLW